MSDKTGSYKGRGEHSVNNLEWLIEDREEKLIAANQKLRVAVELLDLADDQMQYYKSELIDNPRSWNEVIEKVHNGLTKLKGGNDE